ncbi:hypothetical protein ASE66_05955 [Bosea sp. Root483D1]|nr:hypothetical protein ASE66_05955 [Bosea sp. Root483D1]
MSGCGHHAKFRSWRRAGHGAGPEAELEAVQSAIDLLGLRWSEDHAIFPGRLDDVTRTMFLAPEFL